MPELDLAPGTWRVVPAAGATSAHLEYRPADGEAFPPPSTSLPVVVPVLPTLLQMYGVTDVTLSNLSFEHTAGGDCHADQHAAACDNDEGAVAQRALVVGGKSDGVTLTALTFRSLGGFALYVAGTTRLVVQTVAALDCGSGGIFVRDCPAALINNSIVRGYGRRFAAASGLTMTSCRNGTVSHCDVSGGLFSGLAGGGNDDSGAYSVFELNHVHDNGSEDDDGLCDFGGYHGSSGGSVLPLYMRSNIFHSITAFANGGSGMYFDVSSTGWQVSNNLVYNVTNSALHWNVNPGVAQAWTSAAVPMRFTNNVFIAERDNSYYRKKGNHTRGGHGGPWGLGNAAITWNGYTPASFTRNVVVVDATTAPSRGAWFEGRPCGADKLPSGHPPAGTALCSGDLQDNFGGTNVGGNVWYNRTAAAANTPTFPGGCPGTTATSCGSTHGCACHSWAEWCATGQGSGGLWQVDPQLSDGPLRLVSSPDALALGIVPLKELANAGADWDVAAPAIRAAFMAAGMENGAPAPSAATCEVESCVVMPTACAARPECRGCGSLCTGSDHRSVAYNCFLNVTGLGEQASGTTVFPSLPISPSSLPACPWPTKPTCIRSHGNDTLKKWSGPQSKSPAACCAACSSTKGCVGWQLITKRGAEAAECWAMSTTSTKPSSPDTCVSGIPVAPPVPEVRTADLVFHWNKLEPTAGEYDWSSLDAAVERPRVAKGRLMLLLWTGEDAPHWLYKAPFSVGKLAHNGDMSEIVPDYPSEVYRKRLEGIHGALAQRIREHSFGPVFLAVQPCVGSTGDDTPIHLVSGTGRPTPWTFVNQSLLKEIGGPGTQSNSTWWVNFFRDFSQWLATNETAFAGPVAAGELVLVLNAQGESFPLDWIASHLPGSFVKLGQTGHEYQSNYERYRVAEQAPYAYSLQHGRPVRSRAELSAETCWTVGPFQNATACPVPWNVYAMVQWLASAHLDFWNLQPDSVTDAFQDYRPLWRFLNRYAGLRWAWQSRGAWVGFRDGLE